MKKTIIAVLLLGTAAHAQNTSREMTGEYGRGFCDAVAIMMRNRDHYRQMHHYPLETMDQSMKRIYEAGWPPKPPDGYDEKNSIVAHTVNLEMAGIDLYLIVPPNVCKGFMP